jgi:hypothetical protein
VTDTDRIYTTENDVALDLIAALDMYDGSFGAEETTIDKIGEGERGTVVIVLSNGDEYRLTVRAI